MGLQDMVRWLLPREETFYSLIERQCETLDKAGLLNVVQRRAPTLTARVHVSPSLHQRNHYIRMPFKGCVVKRLVLGSNVIS